MKRVSMTEPVGFAAGIGLSSGRVPEAHHRHARLDEAERPTANAKEIRIWAVLFALVILAMITLIIVVVLEEPARGHAALSYRSWIASYPVLFSS